MSVISTFIIGCTHLPRNLYGNDQRTKRFGNDNSITKLQNFLYFVGKLEKFEVPAAVKLCSEVWSPDMGLVTAAFKLKRKDIQERYQHEINRMYAS